MDKLDKKLDKTKENIGVSNLDEETRKKLFNKFVDAGGEILSEKQRKKNLVIDRDKQKKFREQFNTRKKKTKEPEKKPVAQYVTVQKTRSSKPSPSIRTSLRNLKLRLKLKFLRITQFNGLYFNPKYLEKFNNVFKPALMEIQVLYLNLFKSDLRSGNKIIDLLDSLKPIYYELIEMIGNVYDKMTSDQIVEHYRNFPDVPKKVSELRAPLIDLFKKIYILKPFENATYDALVKAVDYYLDIKGKTESIDSSVRKKIKNDLYIIFNKLYPRLFLLFCHYYGYYYESDDPVIGELLDVSSEEKPGKRVISRIFNKETEVIQPIEETEEEEQIEKNDNGLSDAVKNGLEIMYKLNFNDLRNKYDKQGLFQKVSDNDKVLITFLLFSEFDSEYSFILTTNKIKFSGDYISRTDFDFKARLNDLYDEMRKPGEMLKNYASELAQYEKIRNERPVGNTQYIEYTKRLEIINKKKNLTGKLARMAVQAYMDKTAEVLKLLIEDMDSSQGHLLNPQELIEFNTQLEGNKKINGMKIYEAIKTAYYYASALAARLRTGGELSGNIELTDEEETLQTRIIEKMNETEEEKEKNKNQSSTETDKTILEELDDML